MNNNPWYTTWFDTPFYHTLYKHRNDTEAQFFIDNLINYLNPQGAANRFLDLACGKGRHSLYINQKGYDVTGLDLSPQSIKFAQQFSNDTLHFDVHDMREVYQPSAFHYILNMFTSFGYFSKEAHNIKAMQSIAQMLHEDGTVVIDFMNSFKSAFNLRPKEMQTIDGITFYIKRYLDGKFFVKEIELKHEGKHYKFQERVQGLTQKDFEFYCSEAGLKIVDVFGSYDLDYFSKNTSDRLILMMKKR